VRSTLRRQCLRIEDSPFLYASTLKPAPSRCVTAMALHFEVFCGLGSTLAKSQWATEHVSWALSRAFWTRPKFDGPNAWQNDATRHFPPKGGWAPYCPSTRDVSRYHGDVEAIPALVCRHAIDRATSVQKCIYSRRICDVNLRFSCLVDPLNH